MVITVGDVERIKEALEKKNMSVSELLMLIKNGLVCEECKHKIAHLKEQKEGIENVSVSKTQTD